MSLEELRRQSANVLCLGTVIFAALVVAVEWAMQGTPGLASIVAVPAAAVLLVMFLVARNSQSFRYTLVAAMMAEVMALVIAARGNPWQIDMHLAFFGGLAVCAILYDVRAIVLATVLVAVHHIGLGLTFETLIFYNGGGWPRILLHATILVAEGGALAGVVLTTQALLRLATDKTAEAASEAEKVRDMASATEAERSEHARQHIDMLGRLEASFGKVMAAAAAGEFAARVETGFDDEVFNTLAGHVNAMLETVDRGIAETGAVLGAMARTDLTQRVEGDYEGAFNQLKADTNAVAERLTEIVVNLKTASKGLKVATTEIASGASDLSERTAKQAGTIEETSGAMAQLAGMVLKNAQRARDAAVNAGHVTETAEQGGLVMHQATEAMERITTSSRKIASIIGLIDDIAFQTNLLALNASVEAARAGEAGKGFAVVAVEVRRLAQSAAEASKEIKGLIEQSVGEVKSGSDLVEQAATRLTSMLEGARANDLLLESIARDSHDQAGSIEEVNTAMRQLDEMTQHNASLVEETNAAITQTDLQAGELDRIVGLFSIGATREPVAIPQANAVAASAPAGIRGLQARVREAARGYLGKSSAAVAKEWSEF